MDVYKTVTVPGGRYEVNLVKDCGGGVIAFYEGPGGPVVSGEDEASALEKFSRLVPIDSFLRSLAPSFIKTT